MRARVASCWLLVAVSLVHGQAEPAVPTVRYDGQAVVRARLAGEADVAAMRGMGARLYGEAEGIGPVDYLVSPEQRAAMAARGIDFEVLVDDVQPLVDAERQRLAAGGVAGGWFLDFKDYDAINARLAELETLRPDLAEVFAIGSSLEGRAINCIRITGPGTGKPALLVNGCQHAREWISPMVNVYLADRLISDYDTDPEVQAAVDAVEFLIVPVVNPDGYVYSWGPDRFWRKNRRDNGDGTFGVDLNRNWEVGWGNNNGSSPNGGDETYRGTAPFSEPETQVMRDFYLANPQIVANIDFHSYSQLVLWPWGYTQSQPPDAAALDDLGSVMAASILDVHGFTYVNQQAIDLYPASGISIDWTYGDRGVFSYTIELRPNSGNPGFLLPPEQILPTAEENFPAVLDLAAFATQGVIFDFPQGLPEIVEADTPTPVTVQVTSITSALLPETATLLARVGEGGPFTGSALTDLGEGLFAGQLPGAPCGDVVQFHFQVETSDSVVHVSPPDAPGSLYEATAFEIAVTFADDFETDQGWSVANDGLTDGAWERGTPIPASVCDRGNPGADADGSGQCYLTDNSSANSCNSDVDGGTTTLTSPVMDASDPDAAISYWRWYSNAEGSNPFDDVMVVEVSDDGGASWTGLETVGPAGPEAAGGWHFREFPVAGIAGITSTDQFRIRFHVSDLGMGSVVEAGVDGVGLRTLFCNAGGPCPWDLDDDGVVGIIDFLELLAQWGTDPGGPPDFDGDGTVGILDFLDLLAHWGDCL